MSPPRLNTDAINQPPTLAVISPTPRAFTFPTSHNLSDSPYSSPCSSPFQPDLRPLAISTTVTPPPLPFDSPIVSPSTHTRRKSSSSLDVERRPKKGDDDYVKRPENAFILFRRKCCEERAAVAAEDSLDGARKQRQADLSKTISQQWKCLSSEERHYWEELAKEKKKEHERLYPDYVYRPQRQRDKDGKVKKNSKKGAKRGEYDHDEDSVTFVLPETNRVPHGRSISAPNRPLPYHTMIQIPNVYVSPSCPTSPSTPNSLLPMISRRSAHPAAHAEDDFDFRPTNNQLFGAEFQSSDLMRNMFNLDSTTTSAPSLRPLDMIAFNSSINSAGSSGPSSPLSGPYTPTSSTMLEHSFTQIEAATPEEWSMGMEIFPCPDPSALGSGTLSQTEFCSPSTASSEFSWPGSESSSLWSSNSNPESAIIFSGDDFDLNAIPPIQLGLSKYPGGGGDLAEFVEFGGGHHLHPNSQEQFIDERIFSF
jgi:hypothetical protein